MIFTMLKTLPATYIKINMPGVFCVEKTFHRIGNGSSYAGLFLYSVASIALSKDCNVIFYGAHSDDAAGSAYPDCSDAFNQAMKDAIYLGSGNQVTIEAPFVNWTKADVVKKGLELNVPYELTWSCYEGGEKPCGKCGTCIDRAAAFEKNGVKDPALD